MVELWDSPAAVRKEGKVGAAIFPIRMALAHAQSPIVGCFGPSAAVRREGEKGAAIFPREPSLRMRRVTGGNYEPHPPPQ